MPSNTTVVPSASYSNAALQYVRSQLVASFNSVKMREAQNWCRLLAALEEMEANELALLEYD